MLLELESPDAEPTRNVLGNTCPGLISSQSLRLALRTSLKSSDPTTRVPSMRAPSGRISRAGASKASQSDVDSGTNRVSAAPATHGIRLLGSRAIGCSVSWRRPFMLPAARAPDSKREELVSSNEAEGAC